MVNEEKKILVENELPVAVVENNDNFVKESESVTSSVTSSTDITVGGSRNCYKYSKGYSSTNLKTIC